VSRYGRGLYTDKARATSSRPIAPAAWRSCGTVANRFISSLNSIQQCRYSCPAVPGDCAAHLHQARDELHGLRTDGFRALPAQERVHAWLVPPLQVQTSTLVPFAVAPLVTSRQRFDGTPVMVPLPLTFHC
jgi:hypothetical protein